MITTTVVLFQGGIQSAKPNGTADTAKDLLSTVSDDLTPKDRINRTKRRPPLGIGKIGFLTIYKTQWAKK